MIESSADFETKIVRELLPAVNYGALIEKVTVLNASRFSQEYSVCAEKYSKKVNEFWCVGKSITAECSVLFDDTFKSAEKRCRKFILRPNEDFSFYCVYYAYRVSACLHFLSARKWLHAKALLMKCLHH